MATKRRPAYNRQMQGGQPYIYGNTVRKPETFPEKREEYLPKKPKQVSRQVQKNRRNAMHMNAGYVVFLAVAAVITLLVCVNYLKLQSELTSRSRNITALQRELADKKEINNTRLNNATDSVNLEDVRTYATETLGMTHALPEQIVTYEDSAANYVKQYKDIPKSGVSAESGSTK